MKVAWSRVFLAGVLSASCAAPISAANWNVNSSTDSLDAVVGDGLCTDAQGLCSLRAAIQEANADPVADTIQIPAGNFVLSLQGGDEDQSASGDLDIRTAMTLRGAGPGTTTVDGNTADRVLDLHAPSALSVTLQDLALSNGRMTEVLSTSAGIGLRVAAGVALTLHDVDIRDNEATLAFGGGVGVDNRGCFVGTRVRILRNRDPASVGSANALAGGVTTRGATSCFELIDSEISDNVGDNAGAIYTEDSAPIILRRSLIAGNTARFSGAMLLNHNNAVLLEDTTISGNRGNPGAILVDGGATLTLRNCTVTDNRGTGGMPNVVGGIHDVHGGFGRTFLTNTILAGNGPGVLADDCSNATSSAGGNAIGAIAGCTISLMPGDLTNINPQLGALADNGGPTRSHLPGAPILDAAANAACTITDQRGLQRPQDGNGDGNSRCDIGAVEFGNRLFADGFE